MTREQAAQVVREVADDERDLSEAAWFLDVPAEQLAQAVEVWEERRLAHDDPSSRVDTGVRGYASDQIDRLLERVDLEWDATLDRLCAAGMRGAA